MKSLSLTEVSSVLCIGAHCDDIEIGCGATVLRLIERNPTVIVHWIVFTSNGDRGAEARAGAAAFLEGTSGARVEIEAYRERYLPYVAADVKERFDRLGREVDPDLVLTHYGNDLHQDHRLLSELTYNTFRNHLVLEYEILKYDGDLGRPNVFVHLEERHARREGGGAGGGVPEPVWQVLVHGGHVPCTHAHSRGRVALAIELAGLFTAESWCCG